MPHTPTPDEPQPSDRSDQPTQHLTRRQRREAEAQAQAHQEAGAQQEAGAHQEAVAPASPADEAPEHDDLSLLAAAVASAAADVPAGADAPAHTDVGSAMPNSTGRAGQDDDSPLAWRQQHFASHEPPPKKRRGRTALIVTIVVVLILGGLGAGAYTMFQPQVARLVAMLEPNDYTGKGTGAVSVTIKSGDIGSDIATTLHTAGVTKSYDAFYQLLLKQHPSPVFQPGVYKLAEHMSAQSALSALENPGSKLNEVAVIPEGTAEKDILPLLASATKIPVEQLQAEAANVQQFGVPAEAKTLEGFLFPATYTFSPGLTAKDVIKTLVDRSFKALDDAKVAPTDRWKTVILASIVQREAGLAADYPKVSRVFVNRLAMGWDLQSDATVAYGTGHTKVVTTTDAERADASDLYNTYAHPGLPVGPISNPGDLAINAALHPADGTWMYFVTWNLKTGETIFSTTQAEHDAAVAKWQQWMKDNPGYG